PEIRRGRMGAVRLVGQTIAFCGLSCLAEARMLDRFEKSPRGVGSEPGDRQDWQRISGKMRRKSMPVLSVPGARVGGDEVSMAVFHELSRAEGPSQQTTQGDRLSHFTDAVRCGGFGRHPRGEPWLRCLAAFH